MLTRKQHDLLKFINQRLNENGVPPSFDEMKDALELKSKSGIHRLITALEERGFIRRLPHRARAIEVIKVPESMPRRRGFVPEVIEGSGSRPAARKASPAPSFRWRHGAARRADRRRRADRGDRKPEPDGRGPPPTCCGAASISRWRSAETR